MSRSKKTAKIIRALKSPLWAALKLSNVWECGLKLSEFFSQASVDIGHLQERLGVG